MTWTVNTTAEFDAWFLAQTDECQARVDAKVRLLQEHGPNLRRPSVGTLDTERSAASRHTHMKELIVQHEGDPYRILFAFDTEQEAKLLVGGCKGGDDRWYVENIPIADDLLDAHELVLKRKREERDRAAREQQRISAKGNRRGRRKR
jgi:hypothetical protein